MWQPRAKPAIHGLYWGLLLLLSALIVTSTASGQSGSNFGRYYALVIGNQNYHHLKNLKTPLADATEVARVLDEQYGFEVELLRDASREEIMRAISRLRKKLTREQDNLLIYYAGHGYLDPFSDVGYWQPADAEKDNDVNWIPTSRITNLLKVIRAKHVMVVADSCYSGSLLARDSDAKLSSGMEQGVWHQRMFKLRSRTALTSGAEEPVWDAGGGKHSVFAKTFLDVLRNNHEILDGDGLFERIKRPVALSAMQTPQYGDIPMTGHKLGDFLLVPKHLQGTGLNKEKRHPLDPSLLRGNTTVTFSVIPIEEEYTVSKNARIRQQPNVSSLKVGSLVKGASVWVAGQVVDQSWYLVGIPDSEKQGYVYSALLTPSVPDVPKVQEGNDTYTDPITGMQFVYVKPDSNCFQMGSNDGDEDEKPVHQVCLTQGYYLGKYEVTQAQWEKIMGNNPSRHIGNNKPVERVSWDDVQSFISKLNQQSVKNYRLPTEAEWEYACRNGGKNQKYCGSNNVDSVAWYRDNSGSSTHNVGQKQPNGLGLYDMSGNVWEWVQDRYDSEYYANSPTNNPKGPSGGSNRVFRGGRWYVGAWGVRSVVRDDDSPDYSFYDLGFRLARTR